jgi:hypothetical protein
MRYPNCEFKAWFLGFSKRPERSTRSRIFAVLPEGKFMHQSIFAKFDLSHVVRLVSLCLATAFLSGAAHAGDQYLDRNGLPVGGHDVVSYHNEPAPLEGLETITAEYNEVTWRFATTQNRDLFSADPARYAPAYDGHCAYALANDSKARTDPDAYLVVDDVLYLNFSMSIHRRWLEDVSGYLVRSEANWPRHEGEPAARPSRWF